MTKNLQWDELSYSVACCGNFELRPDPDADRPTRMACPPRYVLWWTTEDRWICRFPNRRVAENFVIGNGNEDWPLCAGSDCSDYPLDIEGALRRYEQQTGKPLQIEFDETGVMADLYALLDLGIEFCSRLAYYEVSVKYGEVSADLIKEWGPFVIRCLGARGEELAEHAALIAEMVLRQALAQHELVEEIDQRCKAMLDEDEVLRLTLAGFRAPSQS